MRPLLWVLAVVGAVAAFYISMHFKRLPFIACLGKKKKWLPWTIAGIICLPLWFFSAVHFTLLMAFAGYLFGLYLITDFIWLFIRSDKHKGSALRRFWDKYIWNGLAMLVIAAVITGCGAINAEHIQVTDYSVKVDKTVAKVDKTTAQEPLNIVMIADMHIGTGINKKELREMPQKINKLHPDVVCMAGDIFDERTTRSDMKVLRASLSKIKSRYGTYFVYGNHDLGKYNMDHPWGRTEVEATLRGAGVHILEDKTVLINHRFYIVGRKDWSETAVPERAQPRRTIAQLTRGLNKKYPVILLDHRPLADQIKQARAAGVDLQLSGHTHAGQLTPAGLLDKYIFHVNAVEYGMKTYGNYRIIVTSGYGTWTMPVRVGSPCEIVDVRMTGE